MQNKKIWSLILTIVLFIGMIPFPSEASVKIQEVQIPELVNDYHSVEVDSPMREVEYYDIHTEGTKLTVKGKTARSYVRYRVCVQKRGSSSFMFYPESFGEQDADNGFEKTLDFSGQDNGEYLVSIRFNNTGDKTFQSEPQMKAVSLIRTDEGIFVKQYTAILSENDSIRTADKTQTEYYLDTSLADMEHEVRNGREWSATEKKKLTASEVKTIKAFSNEITAGAASDYEKLLLIHDYMAEHLYYDKPYNDADKSQKRQMAKQGLVTLSPYDLVIQLKSGQKAKTVCNGFSALFAALARSQGIPCRTVSGRSITLSENSWDRLSGEELTKDTHTWNEVYVNGHWIVVDVTRDCSNDYKNNTYVAASPVIYRYSGFDQSKESVAATLLYLKYRETPVFRADPPKLNLIKRGVFPVKITYTKVKGAVKYSIYRSTSPSGTYKKIGTSKTTTYRDKTAKVGKTYYYKVAAVDKNGVETKLSQWRHITVKKK